MGEVIRFIPRSELERARLIRKSRAKYDRSSRRLIRSANSETRHR
jgi:hypothetical protein